MTNPLKQANRGCFLLLAAFIFAAVGGVSLFMLFAMGMSGGGDAPESANALFWVLLAGMLLSCAVVPISGVWGWALVAVSTVREITGDRAAEGSSEPYTFRWTRARQAFAIGLALLAIFQLVNVVVANMTQGTFIFSAISSGTVLYQALAVPFMVCAGSLLGGLAYARRQGRESATALGAGSLRGWLRPPGWWSI